jgi:hypothetical protein
MKVIERIKTHILVFLKVTPFMRYAEKYGRAGQATDGSITYEHCMLNT